MLAICDKFEIDYCVTFNNAKSKCITINYSKADHGTSAPLLSVSISGNLIGNVDRWPHLGNIINAHFTVDNDILACRTSFIGQATSFFCNFQCWTLKLKILCSRHTVAVILILNCGTSRIISLRTIALLGGRAYKSYGLCLTIRTT